MKKYCEIQSLQETIEVNKDNGTHVYYHIFPEYEIHINEIAPHAVQEWHYHSLIEEVILVNTGQLICYEECSHQQIKHILNPGDVICVYRSIHTFANESNEKTQFTVFRLVLQGKDYRDIMKNDKTVIIHHFDKMEE